MDEDAIKQLLAGMTNRDVDRKLYALGMVSVRTDRMSIDAKREQLLEAFRQGKWNGQKSMDSLHKAMMVGVAKAKREKSMPQGTTLVAKVDMKIGKLSIKTGQKFWVTNSQVSQQSSGNIVIDREGRGTASSGVALSEADINQYFQRQ